MASELSAAAEVSLACDKPHLIVDSGDLPATARMLRDLLAHSGCLFDRGVPVKVVPSPDGSAPTAIRLTSNRIVVETHRICRPSKPACNELEPVTLPDRVARMYLEMHGEWGLPTLAGITTAPVLEPDGKCEPSRATTAARGSGARTCQPSDSWTAFTCRSGRRAAAFARDLSNVSVFRCVPAQR